MEERRKNYPEIIKYIEKNGSDLVTLKEYIDIRLTASDKALELAKESLEKRLEGMNAFREQINKIEGTLVTRKELDLILERIKGDKRADIALIISGVATLIAVIMGTMK